ncbi:hypothetical protein NW766_009578 [Fusarium irregulare]|uniref:Uncharacterized protein n=1 Tax=Fusarium irregulare TaxID=2494466 RepID=A0A9W8PI90_9HYPO|nr:hypothetical protein NW766_009578 [Fusarium irregulare]
MRSAVRDATADWKPDLEKRVSKPDIHEPNVDDNVNSPTSNVGESVTIQQPTPEKSLDIKMPEFQEPFEKMKARTI